MYLTTIILVGALMCLGTDVSGHNHVWAQIKCVWAQSSMGTIVSGHNCVWAQSCLGTIMSGHNRVWAQSCLGTIVPGHNRVWAQSCLGTIVSGHSRVGPIMYGHKRGGTRCNTTPKRKKAAANPGMKIYSEAISNPRPVNETSARRNLMVKKSTFTVFKVNSVPIRNNDELLKAVENRQAFIKNKQGLICNNENYKAQLLKSKNEVST